LPAFPGTRAEEKHSINWGALILWPFVILLLYGLSFGPVMMLAEKKRITPNKFVWKFYTPVVWAYFKTPLHWPEFKWESQRGKPIMQRSQPNNQAGLHHLSC